MGKRAQVPKLLVHLLNTATSKKYRLFLVIPVFIIVGAITLFFAKAASLATSFEVEDGTIAGAASVISDSAASGGSAVVFSAAQTATWPGPNDYKVCGNHSILDGPTSPQAGWVTVNPGTDLAALTASSASGTTFYLTAGTHTLPTAYITAKSGNTYIGAPGAVLDGQYGSANDGAKRTAIRGGTNVTIKNLTITRFGQADGKMAGMVNQSAINWGQGAYWTVTNSTISYNGGSGLLTADNGKVTNNCIEYNEQMGVSISLSSHYTQHVNSLIDGNEIHDNNRTNAIESAGVCTGCSGGIKIWNTKGVTISNNNVHNNNGNGIWPDNNNIDVTINHNVSKDNTKRGIMYEISYGGIIKNNYVTGNYVVNKGGVNNPAIYISEAGGDAATKTYLGGTFPAELDISSNYVVDNWQGITLWESAKRYCAPYVSGNPNGTNRNDTSWCPSIMEGKNDTEKAANVATCNNNLAANADVCRWRTQNVKIDDNTFEMTPTATTWCATTNTGCANMSITASTDAPAGTPYAGTVVRDNVTINQNNKFYNNTYIGTWKFYIPNTNVSRSTWQTTWGQDAGSTFN